MSSNVIQSTMPLTPTLYSQTGDELKTDIKIKAAEQPRMKAHVSKAQAETNLGHGPW
jgi:hypothetical protein